MRSDRLNIPLQIAADIQNTRGEKIYLYDGGTWHNLMESPYQFTVSNTNVRTMTLYWGNLQPSASHTLMQNKVYQGGDTIQFGFNFQNSFLIDHFDLYLKNDADSLSVLENVPPTTYTYSYILPQSIDMPKSKVYIDLHATDGVCTTYISKHTHALVPKMNLMYTEPGWAMRANPFLQLNLDIESLFGTDALLYAWETDWEQDSEYVFGKPYFVYSTDYLFNSSTSEVERSEVLTPLQPGWNFVANPHLCVYNLSNLRFIADGKEYSYFEMIDHQLVSRAVYVYKDGGYELVDEILPHEAFYIYTTIPADMNLTLSFYPYYDAPSVTPAAEYWKVKVLAQGTDKDSFSFGASPLATNEYDYRVDLIKAPAKDLFDGISLALYHPDDEDFPHLQEEYRGGFFGAEDQEIVFDFVLDVPDTEPVTFSFEPGNLPTGWTLRFVMEGYPLHISSDATYSFQPEAAGSYYGYIQVFNHPVSNQNLVQEPISMLKVYPNPFNPSTNIRFDLPQTG